MKKYALLFSFIFVCFYTTLFSQCNNVALGKPVTASGVYNGNVPQNAINGSCADGWNSGGFAPQSIDIDLQAIYTINNINIMFDMSPNGTVNHQILTSPDMVTWTVVDAITGYYVTGQLIERCYSSLPLTNVRGVRVSSISSPSWIAIREMGVYTLSAPTTPTITASGPLTICLGDSVTLTSSTAFSYSWSNGAATQSITVHTPGAYSVITNQNPSCVQGTIACTTCGTGTASATVSVNPLPVVSVSPPSAPACINSFINLTAGGANTYVWSPATGLSSTTGATVTASPSVSTTYTVTGTDNSGCVNTATSILTVHVRPNVNVRGPVNPLCDSSKLNWAAWSSVNGTSGSGIISSDLSVLVTKPSGGLSTTAGMFNGSVFPTQYNVPISNTAIRNDLAGLFTFCFNRPVVDPQIALSSIGNPSLSVQVNTSSPYLVIWPGQGMSYPNNTSFIGTEGYTIIQFPGVHTCISFDYLQSETYCNLAFGTLDTNCQALAPIPICAGNSDTLTASGAVSYSWTPTTGLNTSTGAVVVASPLLTTKYFVTGTDINGCSGSDSIVVTVKPMPVVAITGDTIICARDSTTLTATGGGTYKWMPGNFTDSIIKISPASTTTYTVTVSNSSGCKYSSSINVHVNPLPHALFNVNPVCKNSPVIFTDASIGSIANWNWKYGDGAASALQNSSHIYSTCDSFSVKLAVTTNAGCKDSISKTAYVNCLPTANFSFTDVCLHQPMNFYDSSTVSGSTISGWSWNFADSSPLGSIQNISHTYLSSGIYPISLIATTNKGCKDTAIQAVKVHPLPDTKFSSPNVCDGNAVSFSSLSTLSSPDIIQFSTWNFGDASPPNNFPTTTHLYAASGSYAVRLLTVSDSGCRDSTTKTIVVNLNPVVKFFASKTAGCATLCLSFSDSSTVSPGLIVHRAWNVGDGGAIVASPIFDHCYTNTSVDSIAHFTVSLSVTSDSGCVTTGFKNNYIAVYPNPKAKFAVEPNTASFTDPVISITDLSAGASFWHWNFGDSYTSNVFAPAPHTYADTGDYIITLIASTQYNCRDTAYQPIIIEPDFLFYIPNAFTPDGDGVNDTFSGKGVFISQYEMSIFDRWGNLIFFSDDINLPWDGRANHGTEMAQRDVYIYSIKVTDIKMRKHNFNGMVTLLR